MSHGIERRRPSFKALMQSLHDSKKRKAVTGQLSAAHRAVVQNYCNRKIYKGSGPAFSAQARRLMVPRADPLTARPPTIAEPIESNPQGEAHFKSYGTRAAQRDQTAGIHPTSETRQVSLPDEVALVPYFQTVAAVHAYIFRTFRDYGSEGIYNRSAPNFSEGQLAGLGIIVEERHDQVLSLWTELGRLQVFRYDTAPQSPPAFQQLRRRLGLEIMPSLMTPDGGKLWIVRQPLREEKAPRYISLRDRHNWINPTDAKTLWNVARPVRFDKA